MTLAVSGAPAAAEPTLVLNSAGAPPLSTEDGTGFLDIVVGEAFRRAGLTLGLVRLPGERGLINANAGIVDGEQIRIAGLERKYPNLLRVPESIFAVDFSAFATNAALRLEGWHSMRGLRVGFITGWKIVENNIPDGAEALSVRDAAQLFELLKRNRLDVAVYAHIMGMTYIHEHALTNVVALDPPLASPETFVYLHKKHAPLVPKLAEAIRSTKTDGTYRGRYESMLQSLNRANPR